MTPKIFDKTLSTFRVRFVSAEHIDLDHPEAMVVRGGTGIYVSSTGVPTIFDHESVSEVVGETDRRSA